MPGLAIPTNWVVLSVKGRAGLRIPKPADWVWLCVCRMAEGEGWLKGFKEEEVRSRVLSQAYTGHAPRT